MAEIRAFQAYLYHERLKDQMGELVSPPYDVLNEADRESLLRKNSHNSVQLCLKSNNQTYSDVRQTFESWKDENILTKTDKNALYLVEETYEKEGKTHERIGFIGLLKVVPFEDKIVFPHEYTLSGPKADRLELLKNLRAEFSQIFFCYEDSSHFLENLHKKYSSNPPRISTKDLQGVQRKLWIIDNKEEIESIQKLLSKKELLIADGHHRYETALALHQQEQNAETAYVQAYFTNRSAEGFEILPIHRILSLPPAISQNEFLGELKKHFEIRPIEEKNSAEDSLKENQSENIIQFCMYFDSQTGFHLSRKKRSDKDAEIFSLQEDIFERILGWDKEKIANGQLHFAHTTEGFFKELNSLPHSVGFFLPPTDLNLIMKVVRNLERMPQKSTFFYPKIASGLVIYELGSYT